MAKLTDKQAQDELKRLIDEIDNVRKKPRLSPKFKSWQSETSELLEKVFGRSSKQVKEFDRIPYSLAAFSNQTPDSKFDEAFQQGLQKAAIALSSAIKEIQTSGAGGKSTSSPPPPSPPPVEKPKAPVKEEKIAPQAPQTSPVDSNTVLLFATAGNDIKKDVLDFLAKIGLAPLTISCKTTEHDRLLVEVEKNVDAGYALMLLGAEEIKKGNDNAYGLGILVGHLGRDRVCALVAEKVTGIDTYSGITYVPMDAAGAWKFMMIKNLKIAGYEVDANLAL